MDDQSNAGTPQPVIGALVASGLPFQTAVAQVIRHSDYALSNEEFPWRDEAGSDRFLDLVAVKNWFTLTIECKKTRKEMLTFLRPASSQGDTNYTRCLRFSHSVLSFTRLKPYFENLALAPRSAESQYCIVSATDLEKNPRMLEQDVQRLVAGTDAYSRHCNRPGDPLSDRLFIPLLVTNAKLFVADYDASDVSLETGEFPMPPPAKISPVKWVRFRKAFTSVPEDFGERTVFVVAAAALRQFLNKLELPRPLC